MTLANTNLHAASSVSPSLLADPIAFIRLEHDRQCQVCDLLEDLFNTKEPSSIRASAKSIRKFLSEDLHRHIEDEEMDLFPVLAHRCQNHEILDDMLAQLTSEHELDKGLVEPILHELGAIIENGEAQNPTRFFMNARAFAETQRRHLIWENRVVLPLAEQHLTAEDKLAMSRNMAARRDESLDR